VTVPTAPSRLAAPTQDSWTPTRVRIAVLLVLFYAGSWTVQWLHRPRERLASSGQDEISAYERRFDELRSVLPAQGVVGYLGHPAVGEVPPGEARAAAAHLHFRRYLLAQYALAPVLLIESTEPELIVGNFDRGPLPTAPPGFRVVGDFAEGLVLFRRLPP
jgi:hypothetical protein